MSTTCHLSKFEGCDFSDPQLYRSTVGALRYLGFTRPDIAYNIHHVRKYKHQPKEPHWQAVKRILEYLKHTISYGLCFSSQIDHSLRSFSNADWASEKDDRRSVGAYCVFHSHNLISWSCKQQQMVICSSTESEFKSLSNIAVEIRWFQFVLRDLHFTLLHCPKLWCDNIGATYISSNPIFMLRLSILK